MNGSSQRRCTKRSFDEYSSFENLGEDTSSGLEQVAKLIKFCNGNETSLEQQDLQQQITSLLEILNLSEQQVQRILKGSESNPILQRAVMEFNKKSQGL